MAREKETKEKGKKTRGNVAELMDHLPITQSSSFD